jgi:hypothetical protein
MDTLSIAGVILRVAVRGAIERLVMDESAELLLVLCA